jgi:hypothetical protein
MRFSIVRTLFFASLFVILTPTLYSQDAEKPEDSTCLPGQGCDWHTPEAKRLEALAAKDTYPTFLLTLSSGTRNKIISEYRIGDDMWMTIIQANLTDHDIDCSMEDAGGYDRMYEYEAIDEDGKAVEKRHRGTESHNHSSILPPGANDPNEFLLNRVFKLDRPGKYVIRVSRQEPFLKDEKGMPLVVWSNPIIITITG